MPHNTRIEIPSPLTIYDKPENGIVLRNRRVPIEVDGTLTIDVDYYALDETGEFLRVGTISVVEAVVWVGQVRLTLSRGQAIELAAEWSLVPSNMAWLRTRCEADYEKWLTKRPPNRLRKLA